MLVVTRKVGEAVIVGDDVRVVIVDVLKGHTVRLGIDAPDDVDIFREEIYDEEPG